MTPVHASLRAFRDQRREIGRVTGDLPGPTLVCVGSLHGNEPAGVEALERVFTALDAQRPTIHGEIVALAGNVEALARRVRFVDHDLNRNWTTGHITMLRHRDEGPPSVTEDQELLDLLRDIELAVARARGEIVIMDLHTTSGPSAPFVTIADTLRNRRFALQFPAPIVLGLEEQLDGTMLGYLQAMGHVTIGVEGGKHGDPRSIEHLEAAVWVGMTQAGLLPHPEQVPQVADAYARLASATEDIPRVLEVRHRHAVQPGDGFAMEKGYASFIEVEEGELLARSGGGPVHAEEAGRILMPLYQEQGEDGFFLMREFNRAWLAMSALSRTLRLDLLFRLMPGVRRDPDRPDILVIDRRIARFYALEIFHLLGYRRRRLEGDWLVVSRRREG